MTEYGSTAISDTQPRKHENNGKGEYFRFDDDKLDYKYILSIT